LLLADNGVLDDFHRFAVFHRDEPGGADQVGLLEPDGLHLRIVILVAEMGPDELKIIRPVGHRVAHRESVLDLLKDQVGVDRQDDQRDIVIEFLTALQQ